MPIIKTLGREYRQSQLGQASTSVASTPVTLFEGPGLVREIVAVNTGSDLSLLRVTHDEDGHGHLVAQALEWDLPLAPGQAVHLTFTALGFPTKRGSLRISSSETGVTFTAYGDPWT